MNTDCPNCGCESGAIMEFAMNVQIGIMNGIVSRKIIENLGLKIFD